MEQVTKDFKYYPNITEFFNFLLKLSDFKLSGKLCISIFKYT